MPLSTRDLAVVRRHQALQRRTAARTSRLFVAAWDGLDTYNEDDIDTFARVVTPAALAARAAAVAAGVALYGQLARRQATVAPSDINVTIDLRQPFLAVWHALAEGRPYAGAIASGRGGADAIATDLVISSGRRTGDVFAKRAGIRVAYWNRETDADACAWCQDVATQTYTSAETADFGHERCGCTPVPVFADE